MIDYFKIINKYYQPGTLTYKIFVVHAVLVTNKALKIANKLNLSSAEKEFIEEAAMLHDIGVVNVDSPKMECKGHLPYIAHGVNGQEILLAEGLPAHAQVAANHVGVGLTKEEIVRRNLPLPPKDFSPSNLAEEIITYADLYFSKRKSTLWREDSAEEIIGELSGFDAEQVEKFKDWRSKFED